MAGETCLRDDLPRRYATYAEYGPWLQTTGWFLCVSNEPARPLDR